MSTARSYGRVAWAYESIAQAYSLGGIARARASQIELMHPGDRVLYAGVGSGADALLAVRAGARVTAIDVSGRMLDAVARRMSAAGLAAELLRADLFEHAAADPYDVIVVNFVLNVFEFPLALRAMARLAGSLRPQGLMLISDFAPEAASLPMRWLQRAYYRPVNLAAWLLGLCALHPLVDYAAGFRDAGLVLERRQRFGVSTRGPELFESLVARRVEG